MYKYNKNSKSTKKLFHLIKKWYENHEPTEEWVKCKELGKDYIRKNVLKKGRANFSKASKLKDSNLSLKQ